MISSGERTVLVFNHFAVPLGESGGTRHVEMFGRLSGWRPLVIASNQGLHSRRRIQSGDPILRTVPVLGHSASGAARLLSWLSFFFTSLVAGWRAGRVDVVYASTPHLLSPLAGLVLARLRRARFVVEVRDLWPRILVDMGQMGERSPVIRVLKTLERFLYRRADAVVVLAKGSIDEVVSDGARRETVHLIPNAADPADFEVAEDRGRLRLRYGFDGLVFVYAGAHGPANGLNLVLDAAEEVRGDCPEASFVLVGDGVAKGALVEDAKRRCLENVRFLDPVPKAEVPLLLKAADVGLHSLARVELFARGVSPNKLFDYMAAGKPVVTNCPGEVSDFVSSSEGGVAVQPEDFAEGIRELSRHPERLPDMGRRAKAYVEAHHSRALMVERLERMLDGLCPGDSSGVTR